MSASLCNILRYHGNLKITQRKKLVFFGEVFKSFKHKGLKSFSTMEFVSNLINTYLTDIFLCDKPVNNGFYGHARLTLA